MLASGKRWRRPGEDNEAVAEAAGVHAGTVSSWRRDKFPPDEARLHPIAELLGVTVQWLKYGDDSAPARVVRETPRAPYSAGWPEGWRERTYRLVADAAEAGATEEEIAVVRGWMLNPRLQSMAVGGAGKADRLDEIAALERGAREWLLARGRKLKAR